MTITRLIILPILIWSHGVPSNRPEHLHPHRLHHLPYPAKSPLHSALSLPSYQWLRRTKLRIRGCHHGPLLLRHHRFRSMIRRNMSPTTTAPCSIAAKKPGSCLWVTSSKLCQMLHLLRHISRNRRCSTMMSQDRPYLHGQNRLLQMTNNIMRHQKVLHHGSLHDLVSRQKHSLRKRLRRWQRTGMRRTRSNTSTGSTTDPVVSDGLQCLPRTTMARARC